MKKINLLLFALIALSGASCKKSYTCVCTTNTIVKTSLPGFTNTAFTIPSTTDSKAYSEKMTNAQATAACDHEKQTIESTEKAGFDSDFSQYGTAVSYTYSTRCTLE